MTTNADWVGLRECARRLCVTHRALQQAIATGRVEATAVRRDARGRVCAVDAQAVLATWVAHADPSRMLAVRAPASEARLPVGTAPARATLDELRAAKLREMTARAELLELRRREREGDMIDKSIARDHVFRIAREERDALLNWPARVAAPMAAEIGVDARRLAIVLDREVVAFLRHRGELLVRIDGSA